MPFHAHRKNVSSISAQCNTFSRSASTSTSAHICRSEKSIHGNHKFYQPVFKMIASDRFRIPPQRKADPASFVVRRSIDKRQYTEETVVANRLDRTLCMAILFPGGCVCQRSQTLQAASLAHATPHPVQRAE